MIRLGGAEGNTAKEVLLDQDLRPLTGTPGLFLSLDHEEQLEFLNGGNPFGGNPD